ncbi:MAG: thioesterase family protein [Planctomycetota bacterium]
MTNAYPTAVRLPVLWGDLDAFGHVNNARYFTWFEAARLDYFREVGVATSATPSVGPILARTECDFLRPVSWPGEVTVGARTTRVGTTSFHMEYAIWQDEGPDQPVARATGVVVLIDYRSGTKVAVPDALRAKLLA